MSEAREQSGEPINWHSHLALSHLQLVPSGDVFPNLPSATYNWYPLGTSSPISHQPPTTGTPWGRLPQSPLSNQQLVPPGDVFPNLPSATNNWYPLGTSSPISPQPPTTGTLWGRLPQSPISHQQLVPPVDVFPNLQHNLTQTQSNISDKNKEIISIVQRANETNYPTPSALVQQTSHIKITSMFPLYVMSF